MQLGRLAGRGFKALPVHRGSRDRRGTLELLEPRVFRGSSGLRDQPDLRGPKEFKGLQGQLERRVFKA